MLKFAKDLHTSGRILVIMSETKYARKFGKKERQEIKAEVICGSNGKESTRYCMIYDGKVENNMYTDMSKEEFVKNYPKQCEKFKNMFKKEYEDALKELSK